VVTGPPQVHPGVGLVSHQIAVHLYDLPAVGSGVTIGYPRWWPRSRCCGRGGLPPELRLARLRQGPTRPHPVGNR